MMETIETIGVRSFDLPESILSVRLGSRSEGTTTIGLESDFDFLNILPYNVIQDYSERTQLNDNVLVIQDEAIAPGYCFLQKISSNLPFPMGNRTNDTAKDKMGRILLKNTIVSSFAIAQLECSCREGPSLMRTGEPGFPSDDKVLAFLLKSWPLRSRSTWQDEQMNYWPTKEVIKYAQSTKCLVVGVCSKVSENSEYEWRISTSLAERCLMFNLNITQIRCFVLMKMILKTYINIDTETVISSFMCKTVLFYCVASKHPSMWIESKLLECLSYCLYTLKACIQDATCPHFIFRENNLMAGKLSQEVKTKLLKRMSTLLPLDVSSLFCIHFDDLGRRLQQKLSMMDSLPDGIRHPYEYILDNSATLLYNIARSVFNAWDAMLTLTKRESIQRKIQFLLQKARFMIQMFREGGRLEKIVCQLYTTLICTSVGSLMVSLSFKYKNRVSPESLAFLNVGLESDVASSRLKLTTVLLATGDNDGAIGNLIFLEDKFRIGGIEPVCGCYDVDQSYRSVQFCRLSSQPVVKAFKCIVAFCVKFDEGELNCIPHELRYELYRSTQEDLRFKGFNDRWMNYSVIDSLPYLYFLQYKTNGILMRRDEQVRALTNLMVVIETSQSLAHRETALNLLGQCMENENQYVDALKCYVHSLRLRGRNNAAKIHICRCLAEMANNKWE